MTIAFIGLSLALMQPVEDATASDFRTAVEAAQQADGTAAGPSEPAPIIVTAENKVEKKQIIVGSRIPQKPLIQPGPVATSTGTRGLTPGSGMDPAGGGTRTITTKECKSDDPAVGKQACRALVSADQALAAGNSEDALFWLRSVSSWQSDFSPAERLIGAQRIFALGRDTDNPDLRLEALLDMLDTKQLPEAEQLSAARSAAAIGMQQGKDYFASLMLERVIEMDPADAQSLANLAILQRRAEDPQASATMRRAIAVREESGRKAPKGWRDFAAFGAAPSGIETPKPN